jgi:hypothetical protein
LKHEYSHQYGYCISWADGVDDVVFSALPFSSRQICRIIDTLKITGGLSSPLSGVFSNGRE